MSNDATLPNLPMKFALVGIVALSIWGVWWFQLNYLNEFELLPFASILYLPAGIKVVALLTLRFPGALGAYAGWCLFNEFSYELASGLDALILPLIWTFVPYLTLQQVLKRLGLSEDLKLMTTYHLVVIAFAVSIANALVIQGYLHIESMEVGHYLRAVWSMTAGDVSGIVLCLIALTFARRAMSHKSNDE